MFLILQCGSCLVILVVFLAQTHGKHSRFRAFSNHSGQTANPTSNRYSYGRVHTRSARSDNMHFHFNLITNRSITNEKVYKENESPKTLSTGRYIVVFDVHDSLCSVRGAEEEENIAKVTRDLPECPIFFLNYTSCLPPYNDYQNAYIFLPFLQILFDYLLGQGVRIVFYTGGFVEKINQIIPKLLKSYWGSEKYETLRSEGQFMTFSVDKELDKRDSAELGWRRLVKNLNRIIRDEESLSDIILVDDDSSFTKRDQELLIIVQVMHPLGKALNNIYYLLGLFKTYFEEKKYRKLPLREGIGKIFSEYEFQNSNHSFPIGHPFSIEMTNIGLLEVQKLKPKARLYTEADKFPS